jgi:hypothetical protein
MQDEPDERASNEEDAESRAYRRIADALERDDIDELAAAPRPGVALAGVLCAGERKMRVL